MIHFILSALWDSAFAQLGRNPIAALAGYSVNVQVIAEAFGTPAVSSANAVRVQVTVTTPAGGSIVVSGYRTNYN